MDGSLISIVIPAYNAEKRLNRCLASVCGQSWHEIEVWVVNDGSTDATEQIASAWAQKDSRVHVISQANGGVSAARNRALQECRGVWVRFVDADDELPADSLECMVNRAEKENSDLILAGYEHILNDVAMIRNLAKRDDTVSWEEYLKFMNPNANSFFCGVLWNKLFRRDLIEAEAVRFQSGLGYGEDFLFVCGYLRRANRISFSTDVVYRYHRHKHSMTVTQALDSVAHPIKNLKTKKKLYDGMKELYQYRNVYDRYRGTLWLYMLRVTVNQ